MTGFIYLITNSVNGKRYIGKTGKSIITRLKEHLKASRDLSNELHFARAIRKHGEASFSTEVLESLENPSRDFLSEREKFFIAELKPEYNKTPGGDGWSIGMSHTVETKAKMKASATGRVTSQETKDKLSAIHTGRIISPEWAKKVSVANTGKMHTQETKDLIGANWKGRSHSNEAKEKMSTLALGRVMAPETRDKIRAARTGTTRTPEVKERMRLAQLARYAKTVRSQATESLQ